LCGEEDKGRSVRKKDGNFENIAELVCYN